MTFRAYITRVNDARIINISIKSITSSQIRVYLGVFWPAESVFEDYISVPRHADAQEKILSPIIVCCSVLTLPWGFLPAEYIFGDYFGVPRHVNASETISS